MKSNIKFLKAVELTVRLASIKRTIGYRKRHKENDAEHSYQLALVSWSVNHQYKLGLDDEKIIKIALVHDLVEIYSGDVDAHSEKKRNAAKKEEEQKALQQMKNDYADLKEITDVVEEYEKKESTESRFVNIMDKIIPDRHVYSNDIDYYHKRKVSIDAWLAWLHRKIDYSTLPPMLKELVDDVVKDVSLNYKGFYYNKKYNTIGSMSRAGSTKNDKLRG